MIYTDLFHHIWGPTAGRVRSHRLHPSEWVTVFCILSGEKENILSILEDHLLESISSIEWELSNLKGDFTYISENFNHFIQNISEEERVGLGVVFAVLIDTELAFAHIGDTSVLLVEEDGSITDLSNNDTSKVEFQAISSGEVLPWSHMYLSSSPLENRLSDDLIRDLSSLNQIEWKNIITDVFKKEIQDTIHVGYISNSVKQKIQNESRKSKQLDILRRGSWDLLSRIQKSSGIRWIQSQVSSFFASKKQETKIVFLAIGIVLLFSLLYLLFSALFGAVSSPERDSKNQLIQAQELIDNSQKIINNPAAFNQSIQQAEELLFELRDKRIYMTDTQSLLARIEAMKKEVNDVQTIDMSKLNPVMQTQETNISPIGVYEYNKKLTLIWEDSAIVGYVRGEETPRAKSYPTGERARDFDFDDDGRFFILTEWGKVLSERGSEITYTSNSGKNEWSSSPIIGTFNGNIYLTNPSWQGIWRYRPGINGFSSPAEIIGDLWEKILDIGIDGGIYSLLQSGKIVRYIWGTAWEQKGLIINKIPGEYTIGKEDITQIFVHQNLSYTYVLSGNNVWIFSPDSKRFQDVTAWNYIAQLELQTTEEVRSISIPRDGLIYIVTNLGVYELKFEVADGKIILR